MGGAVGVVVGVAVGVVSGEGMSAKAVLEAVVGVGSLMPVG